MPLESTPLVGAFGVELRGLDLSQPLDRDAASAVRAAFLRHKCSYSATRSSRPSG